MNIPRPHFLLFSDAVSQSEPDSDQPCAERGAWRFVLEAVDGDDKLEVEDEEPNVGGDRLDLLAVVRGLEALDQPSRVTLVTSSRYVARGFRYGLGEWRENGWQWERFGQMAPVRNGDLWQRVDRALQYHRVDCRAIRSLRQDREEPAAAGPVTTLSSSPLDGHSTAVGGTSPIRLLVARPANKSRFETLCQLLRPVSAAFARRNRSISRAPEPRIESSRMTLHIENQGPDIADANRIGEHGRNSFRNPGICHA
jgi:ribonuclease HI